jgi:hypothetical protein
MGLTYLGHSSPSNGTCVRRLRGSYRLSLKMFTFLTLCMKSWKFNLGRRLPRQSGPQYRVDSMNIYIQQSLRALDRYASQGDWDKYFTFCDLLARRSFAFRTWAFIRTNPTWWLKYPIAKMDRIIRMSYFPHSQPLARRVWIPQPGKPKGRPLTVACEAQRLYECLYNKLYEPFWRTKLTPSQYGRQGVLAAWRSIPRLATSYQGMLTFDYSKFYDKINFNELIHRLRADYGIRGSFLLYLRHLLNTPFVDSPDLEGFGSRQHAYITGLPQGSPLSPILSLLTLELLMVYRGPYHYLGYIDDGLLFSDSPRAALQSSFESKLGLGVELKPGSVEYISRTSPKSYTFLGLEFLPGQRSTQRSLRVKRRSGEIGAPLPLRFSPTDYAKAYAPTQTSPYHPYPYLLKAFNALHRPLANYIFFGTHRYLGGTEYPFTPRINEVFLKNSLYFQPLKFYPRFMRSKYLLLLLSSFSSYKLEYFLTFWSDEPMVRVPWTRKPN